MKIGIHPKKDDEIIITLELSQLGKDNIDKLVNTYKYFNIEIVDWNITPQDKNLIFKLDIKGEKLKDDEFVKKLIRDLLTIF